MFKMSTGSFRKAKIHRYIIGLLGLYKVISSSIAKTQDKKHISMMLYIPSDNYIWKMLGLHWQSKRLYPSIQRIFPLQLPNLAPIAAKRDCGWRQFNMRASCPVLIYSPISEAISNRWDWHCIILYHIST